MLSSWPLLEKNMNTNTPASITIATIKQNMTAEELQWTKELVEERGEQWVIDNWRGLEMQLEYIRTL